MDEATIALLDGRRVRLRPPVASDHDPVGRFFDSLAEASLEARRIATVHAGTSRARTRLIERTPDHGAIIAAPAGDEGSVVGFAAWTHLPDEESCEIALVVSAAWQNVRLGSSLLDAIVRDARAEGFRHFHARMLGGNMRMLQLLRDVLGHDVTTRVQHGLVRVDFEAA